MKFHIRLEAVLDLDLTVEEVRNLPLSELAQLTITAGSLTGESQTISVTEHDDWTTRCYGPRRAISTPAYEYNGKSPTGRLTGTRPELLNLDDVEPYGKSMVETDYSGLMYGTYYPHLAEAELRAAAHLLDGKLSLNANEVRNRLDEEAMYVPKP